MLKPRPLPAYLTWLRTETRVLPAATALAYDVEVARVYGALQGQLEAAGRALADADLQIAATAIHHGLELVTGNLRHFRRIPGLRPCAAFDEARRDQSPST